MARILLVVDLSYQSYRQSAAHKHLTSDGTFTGGLYGFFVSLGKWVRETGATELLIGCDAKPYMRSVEFPEYKMLRKATSNDELLQLHKATMPLLQEVFARLGIPVWSEPGFEFDDLVGHLVHKYRHRYDCIIAASNDSDLYQLLFTDRFELMTDSYDKAWTSKRLAAELQVTPEQYMLATALTGTHNDLPGIPKVGPVTAMKAVRDPALLRRYKESHGELIERNLRLIKLPHEAFPWDARIPMASGHFYPRLLYQTLGRYDIDVTASMVSALERVLPS